MTLARSSRPALRVFADSSPQDGQRPPATGRHAPAGQSGTARPGPIDIRVGSPGEYRIDFVSDDEFDAMTTEERTYCQSRSAGGFRARLKYVGDMSRD